MQTFLPCADLVESAQCLDDKRLGNQRREAKAILNAMLDPKSRLRHHPAVLMWQGYSSALRLYYDAVVAEWIMRGFLHNGGRMQVRDAPMPWWLGDERLHSSHRAALMEKNPGWYRQFDWSEKPAIDYYWPVRADENGMVEVSAGRVIK